MDKKILSKRFLFDRDDTGELIPQNVKLEEPIEGENFYIKAIPLTRGYRKKIQHEGLNNKGDTTHDMDIEIALDCCKEPTFTREELENSPIGFIENIVTTIFRISNLEIGDKTKKESLEKKESDFQKASK